MKREPTPCFRAYLQPGQHLPLPDWAENLPTAYERARENWWSQLDDANRKHWIALTGGSGTVADAWETFLASKARGPVFT